MQIPEHKIQEVLERADIVALVSRHVELKKAGRSYKGRCPFHQEKTPSFQVTPDLRIYKCFGCGAGGDAISFLQRYLGKSFVDTVVDLAREVGVDLSVADDPQAKERQQIKEATDFAARHFRARLESAEGGGRAREYLRSRGVSDEISKAFGLGWSVNAWGDLADALLKEGMLEWGAQAGLVLKRQKGEGYYDFFRGRLMIPIRSPEGRTIAFGGRLVEGTDGPKYFNSRESRLYNKSETLYGLDQARDEIRRRKSAILVEGYFDVIGLHQAGVKNAVALCSTALTPSHLSVLARAEAKELVLLLDGDDAGRKAVEHLAGPILAQGGAAKVALLPQGEDPDDYARKVGQEGVEKLIRDARTLTEHLFASTLPDGARSTFEAKMKALDRLRPIAAALPVGLTRSAFFGAMSGHFGLPMAELEASLRGKAPPVRAVPKPSQGGPPGSASAVPRKIERPPDRLEAALVAAVLREPRLSALDRYRAADEISHPGLRTVLAHVQSGGGQEVLFDASQAVQRALGDAAWHVPKDATAREQWFLDLCREIKLNRIKEQLDRVAEITGRTANASELDDETRRLLAERGELLDLQRRLQDEKKDARRGAGG